MDCVLESLVLDPMLGLELGKEVLTVLSSRFGLTYLTDEEKVRIRKRLSPSISCTSLSHPFC